MADKLDRAKLAKLLAMLGSSFDGEVINGGKQADRLIRNAGMSWEEAVVEPLHALEIARDACRELLDDNENLRAALAQRGGQADWSPVSTAILDHRAAASWALQRHAEGDVRLSDFEVDFLGTCSRWGRPLTPKRQPIFDRIFTRIHEQTGLRPPP